MFIPLRVHSTYSKGKGGTTLQELASWVSQCRLAAAALTDIENIYGWNEWKKIALDSGFNPVFGCEIKLQGKSLLFLVKNRKGYWNLMEILNQRKIEKTEGLVTVFIPDSSDKESGDNICFSQKEDLYIGGDFFNLKRAVGLAKKENLPVVWTNPLKYIQSPERLILLHSIQKKIPFPPEWQKLKNRVELFGPAQESRAVAQFGSEVKKLFKKTFEIADKCRFPFEHIILPLPQGLFSTSLRDLARRELKVRKDLSWRERQRARMELEVIEQSGFAPYFLIVHDVVRYARCRGVLHNLKGSGASSFLAYLLGISHINPVVYDLCFERFLNRGRADPPDIDLDFDSRRRDEMISYVLKKYSKGKTGAAFVCSLKNFRARSALYETARAFGISPEEARTLSKRIPLFAEPVFLKENVSPPGYAKVWKMASLLDSVYSEKSLHVGGIILTPDPLARYLPTEKSAKGYRMSQYDRDAVEDLKLIKLDLLSVRGLAALSETKKVLKLRNIPLEDDETYERLKKGRTIGCFQVESPAMMNLLRRMRPKNIYELTQALALIRPGPTRSGMKEALLRSREGKPAFKDSFMAKVIPETDGILLYEEQVMQIAERVAGMLPEKGDCLRRALKKKKVKPKLKNHFFAEAKERGYTLGEIKKLWKIMEEFSSYSFNKAHSASYANMAYQAVYLKVHYPVVYLGAVLNAGGGYYGLAEYIEEAKRMGIKILKPDLNRSGYGFEVEGGNIRVGLHSIKGVGIKFIDRIIKEKENGVYLSVDDFISRVSLTKTELLSLIKAGVLDFLEPRRTRQILHYFRGLKKMGEISDLDQNQKRTMLVESLGFEPEGDSLSLYEKKTVSTDKESQNTCGKPGGASGESGGCPAETCQQRAEIFLSF